MSKAKDILSVNETSEENSRNIVAVDKHITKAVGKVDDAIDALESAKRMTFDKDLEKSLDILISTLEATVNKITNLT